MVRPFPYAWLPRWTRDEVSLGHQVLQRLLPASAPRAVREALPSRFQSLLGGTLSAWPGAPRVLDREDLRARFDGDVLCPVMRHPTLGVITALIDAPFALALAARAMGADDEGAMRASAGRSYGAAQEGALAILCAQASMLACAPSPPPVIRAVTDRVSEALAAVDAGPVVAWPWRASVGIFAGEIVLVLPARKLMSREAPSVDLLELSDAAIPARVIAARETLPAVDVAGLAMGDVLSFEGALRLDENSALGGEMTLALGGIELPVTMERSRWNISGPARYTRRYPVGGQQGSAGADESPGAVRTEMLRTVATEVEVIVAQGTFSVGEIAAWRVGEVISLPARVGESVWVRAGGVPIARGELCDVDGSIGVRITERL